MHLTVNAYSLLSRAYIGILRHQDSGTRADGCTAANFGIAPAKDDTETLDINRS